MGWTCEEIPDLAASKSCTFFQVIALHQGGHGRRSASATYSSKYLPFKVVAMGRNLQIWLSLQHVIPDSGPFEEMVIIRGIQIWLSLLHNLQSSCPSLRWTQERIYRLGSLCYTFFQVVALQGGGHGKRTPDLTVSAARFSKEWWRKEDSKCYCFYYMFFQVVVVRGGGHVKRFVDLSACITRSSKYLPF